MRTLSITINDDVYAALKHSVSSRQISKFVNEAVKEKLNKKNEEFFRAYLEASQDKEREKELQEWDTLNLEGLEAEPLQNYPSER